MGNPNELRRARQKAAKAAHIAEEVAALPRRVGQRVRWSNGVIWTRYGDDDWRPEDLPDLRHPSEHVASGDWRTGWAEEDVTPSA